MLLTPANYHIDVREYEYASNRVPEAADGYRLCFLSDLHIGSISGLADQVFDLVSKIKADAFLLGGDHFVERTTLPEWQSFAASLVKSLGTGRRILSVYGNHDHPDLPDVFEDNGIANIEGQTINPFGNDCGVALTGVPFTPLGLTGLEQGPGPALGYFNILLTHSPDFAFSARDRGFDMFLCGHTHAGQVCLPGGVIILRSAKAPRRICARQWSLGSMAGYTSPGIGTSVLPIRLNCAPEIAILTLRTTEESAVNNAENPERSAWRICVSLAS